MDVGQISETGSITITRKHEGVEKKLTYEFDLGYWGKIASPQGKEDLEGISGLLRSFV